MFILLRLEREIVRVLSLQTPEDDLNSTTQVAITIEENEEEETYSSDSNAMSGEL